MSVPIRLTRAELAQRLRLQPITLAHWAVQGKGPKFIALGTRVLYDLDEVQRWEAEHTHQSTAEFDSPSAANVSKARDAVAAARA